MIMVFIHSNDISMGRDESLPKIIQMIGFQRGQYGLGFSFGIWWEIFSSFCILTAKTNVDP